MRATFVLLLSLFVVCGMSLEATQQKVLIKVCSSTPTTSCNTNCSQYYALSAACWDATTSMPGSNTSFVFECEPVPQGCFTSTVYGAPGCEPSHKLQTTQAPCHFCAAQTNAQYSYNYCNATHIEFVSCRGKSQCNAGCTKSAPSAVGSCTSTHVMGLQASIFVDDGYYPCSFVKATSFSASGRCQTKGHGDSLNTWISYAMDGTCNPVFMDPSYDIVLSCVGHDVNWDAGTIPHISELEKHPRQMAALVQHLRENHLKFV